VVDVDGNPATGGAEALWVTVGVITNIDQKHGRFLEIKAVGGVISLTVFSSISVLHRGFGYTQFLDT
jgi:hypothetical protein